MVTLANSSSFNLVDETRKVVSSSVDIAYYQDPDLLIKEYFASSSSQRALSRQVIINQIKSLPEIVEILKHGSSGKHRDGYDAAVNLLAESSKLNLLDAISRAFLRLSDIPDKHWEILIKSIACAYKINPIQRFSLIIDIIRPVINKRILKAIIIDTLSILADDIHIEVIQETLNSFTADQDEYIRDYANETLQEIL
jgi:hypothetical protein